MAVPEFYSGKILYPAIAVLIALSALFGVAIRPRLVPNGSAMVGKQAPSSPSRWPPTARRALG